MGEWRNSSTTPDFGNRGEGSASIQAALPPGKHKENLIYIKQELLDFFYMYIM
jgi:hypothetical protein